ncbi:baseplate hub protein [Achromobacter anxifer]|uniref:baseplate hub protein n=1 Tax=Achromobacter anxifer TaxID=1287737 RepID=UPI002157EF3B|nr:hypothetical protein [Achromobacter anxifer]
MSLVKRRIDVTISLGLGKLGDEKGPDITLSGYRVSVNIPAHVAGESSRVKLLIYGLNQEMMNKLTAIGLKSKERRGKNLVSVSAMDDFGVPRVVYEGDIDTAWADYEKAPEGMLNVMAQVAGSKELKPVPAKSYPGPTGVHEIASEIAESMGYACEKNGEDTVLANPYLSGTDMDQMRNCAQAARINYTIDRGTLAIWPPGGSRKGDPIAISPQTGLIGYPAFTGSGISLRSLYNPDFSVGKKVLVTSAIEVANGEWTITGLSHHLEAEVPGGAWLSQVKCERKLDG